MVKLTNKQIINRTKETHF